MSDDRLEEFFRKKLGSYTSNVPSGLWDRIRSSRNGGEGLDAFKRWYLFGSFGFMCFLGVVAWAFHPVTAGRARAKTAAVTVAAGTPAASSAPSVPRTTTASSRPETTSPHSTTMLPNSTTTSSHPQIARRSWTTLHNSTASGTSAPETPAEGPSGPGGAGLQRPVSLVYTPMPGYISTEIPGARSYPFPVPNGAAGSTISNMRKATGLSESCNYWFFNLFASVDRATLDVTGPNAATNQLVRNSQLMKPYYGAGFFVGRTFGPHFSLGAGFSYTTLHSLYNISDSAQFTLQRNWNVYRFFDVPVLAGYTIGVGPLDLTAHAGLVVNAWSTYAGYINNGSSILAVSSGVFKKETGLSLMGGVMAAYKCADNFQLFAEPFVRYPLSPLSTSSQPFTEKIRLEGFTFGIRYRFMGDHGIPCPQWR